MNTIKYLAFLITVGVVAGVSLAQASIFDFFTPYVEDPIFGAPSQTFQRSIYPETSATYSLGSSTLKWLNFHTQNASTTNMSVSGYYNIGGMTSASTTNWESFYQTPSTRITDGTNLTWSGNTLNVDDPFSIDTLNAGTLNVTSLASSPLVVGGTASSTIYGNGEYSIFPNVTITNASTTYLTVGSRMFGDVTGTLTGNASTATALASDPTDCGSNTWANAIAASGNLTCAAVTYAGITAMTSANFAGLISDETGTDKVVFNTSPTFAGIATIPNASTTYLTVGSGAWFPGSGVWNSSGNVGIGTTNPIAKLNINSSTSTIAWSGMIRNTYHVNAAGVGAGLKFQLGNSDTSGELAKWAGVAGVSETGWENSVGLAFFTSLSPTEGSEKVRITNTGNVGIGTTNPLDKLVISNNGAEGLEIAPGSATGKVSIKSYGRAGTAYDTMEFLAYDFSFLPQGGDLSITGNVGIGTTGPDNLDSGGSYKLVDIHGGAGYGLLSLSSTATADNLHVGGLQFGTTGASNKQSSAMILGYLSADSSTNAIGNLRFLTSAGAGGVEERMRITSSGNVGIGDTTPDYLLDVAGTLGVDGNAYFALDVSALTFTDRTPYPKDLQEAYDSVLSVKGINGQVDHSKLNPFIKSTNASSTIEGRNLSALVSAQNAVIQDILKKIGNEPLGSISKNGDFEAIRNEIKVQIEELKPEIQKMVDDAVDKKFKELKLMDKLKLMF